MLNLQVTEEIRERFSFTNPTAYEIFCSFDASTEFQTKELIALFQLLNPTKKLVYDMLEKFEISRTPEMQRLFYSLHDEDEDEELLY